MNIITFAKINLMKVSIVIPAYNEEKSLGQCLKGIVEQIEQPDEVIVVDNNSTDKTAQIAKQFGAKVIKEEKQGMIFARNRGFNEAKFEILARCDADDIIPPDWIIKIKKNFTDKKIDGLTGPVVLYDVGLSTTLFANIYSVFMKILLRGRSVIMGPNMIITKAIWNRIANQVCLNETLVHEDVDLTIHIIKNGGKIYHDKNLLVKTSGRRIKFSPLSFFVEYPVRLIRTINLHR